MNDIVDIATLAFVVGGILVLARPGSQGPGLISAFGQSFTAVLATATGSTPYGFTPAATSPGGGK